MPPSRTTSTGPAVHVAPARRSHSMAVRGEGLRVTAVRRSSSTRSAGACCLRRRGSNRSAGSRSSSIGSCGYCVNRSGGSSGGRKDSSLSSLGCKKGCGGEGRGCCGCCGCGGCCGGKESSNTSLNVGCKVKSCGGCSCCRNEEGDGGRGRCSSGSGSSGSGTGCVFKNDNSSKNSSGSSGCKNDNSTRKDCSCCFSCCKCGCKNNNSCSKADCETGCKTEPLAVPRNCSSSSNSKDSTTKNESNLSLSPGKCCECCRLSSTSSSSCRKVSSSVSSLNICSRSNSCRKGSSVSIRKGSCSSSSSSSCRSKLTHTQSATSKSIIFTRHKTATSPGSTERIRRLPPHPNLSAEDLVLDDRFYLTSYLGQSGLDENWVKEIAKQISSGLQHMHKFGFVHRDVTIANVIVEREDQKPATVKLGGLFALADKDLLVRRNDLPESWLPPEVLKLLPNESYPANPTQDSWQFGLLLVVCLTGSMPWGISDKKDLSYRAWFDWCRRSTARVPPRFKTLSPRFLRLLRRLLQPKPDLRAPVHEVDKYLHDHWLEGEGTSKGIKKHVNGLIAMAEATITKLLGTATHPHVPSKVSFTDQQQQHQQQQQQKVVTP